MSLDPACPIAGRTPSAPLGLDRLATNHLFAVRGDYLTVVTCNPRRSPSIRMLPSVSVR